MTVRDVMAMFDRRIFGSRIVKAVALIDGSIEVQGAFFHQPREIQMPGGAVQTVGISFECQYVDAIGTLDLNELVSIDNYGSFRFLRELLPGGDESGLTIIELGEAL
jgi:hypothetical protein